MSERGAGAQGTGGAVGALDTAPAVSAGPSAAAAVAAAVVTESKPANEEGLAPEPTPDGAAAAPAPALLDLEQVKALWSPVADAVREQNAMVAALLSDSVPVSLAGDLLTVSFPEDAAFSKKKAEANLDLLRGALRSITGRGLAVTLVLTARRDEAPPARLGEEELLERLKRDFGAEEVFNDDDPETEG